MPQIGEKKIIGGESGTWDGTGWLADNQQGPQQPPPSEGSSSILPRSGAMIGGMVGGLAGPVGALAGSAAGSSAQELLSSIPKLWRAGLRGPYGATGVGEAMGGAATNIGSDVLKAWLLNKAPGWLGSALRSSGPKLVAAGEKAGGIPLLQRAAVGPVAKMLGLGDAGAVAGEAAALAGPPAARAVGRGMTATGEIIPSGATTTGLMRQGVQRAVNALRGPAAGESTTIPGPRARPYGVAEQARRSTEVPGFSYKEPPPSSAPPSSPSPTPTSTPRTGGTVGGANLSPSDIGQAEIGEFRSGANLPGNMRPTELTPQIPDTGNVYDSTTGLVSPRTPAFSFEGEAIQPGQPPAVGGTPIGRLQQNLQGLSPELAAQLEQSPGFGKLPSDAERIARTTQRNTAGRWPK